MAVRPIVVRGYPTLHRKAVKVTSFDQNLHRLVEDMIETMRAAPGVGLAAPQVGVPLRVAVIEVDQVVTVLVNPEIVKHSDEEEELDEGCLSLPGYWGRITRRHWVTVKARDQYGKDVRVRGEGLLGQALQHEIDHLHGKLYIDYPGVPDTLQRTRPERTAEPREESAAAPLTS